MRGQADVGKKGQQLLAVEQGEGRLEKPPLSAERGEEFAFVEHVGEVAVSAAGSQELSAGLGEVVDDDDLRAAVAAAMAASIPAGPAPMMTILRFGGISEE